MIIEATAYETVIKARIVARKTEDFQRALDEIKSLPEADRYYDETEHLWVIKNPERYRYVEFIKNALETRDLQGKLF